MKNLQLNTAKGLARAISMVENAAEGYREWLASLPVSPDVPVIGITGPPGAGKSTVVSALISHYISSGKKIGVLAVDPTSPFNYGSLLGDRIRMEEHYNNPNVFIRSLATRGSLGGLSAKTIEILEVMRAAYFDLIIVETVGVGQSEVEIAGLADTTVLVLVPESGDEIQNLKSGVMEIADIFVVNKSDRPGAHQYLTNLKKILHDKKAGDWKIPVIAAVATEGKGIDELAQAIEAHQNHPHGNKLKAMLLAEKAYQLIQEERMADIDKKLITEAIEKELGKKGFNLHKFIGGLTTNS